MENNKIKVLNEINEEMEVEVLDIFGVNEYPEKEYILYTQSYENGEDIECYVSILNQTDSGYTLQKIEDEEEWKLVQEAIKEATEEE